MINRALPIIAFLLSSFSSGTLMAHHSVPVNFDTSGSLEVTGTITEIRWVNPHSQIFLDVVNESGEIEPWLVEMNAINTIKRLSRQLDLNVEEFIVGEQLTVVGWPGRNSNAVYFRKAILASGKEVIWESRLDPDLHKVETFD